MKIEVGSITDQDGDELKFLFCFLAHPETDETLGDLQDDFRKIISQKADEILKAGEPVSEENEMCAGALIYSKLRECGCEVLSRKSHPSRRLKFENKVIENIPFDNRTTIKISALATGLLFGEFVLLTKLINNFSQEKLSRNIEFDCIDTNYIVCIPGYEEECAENPELKHMKEDEPLYKAALNDFVKKIEGVKNLLKFEGNVTLRFFPNIYTFMTWYGPAEDDILQPEHDILVGADRDATDLEVEALKDYLVDPKRWVFLERQNDKPYLITPENSEELP